MIQRFLFNALKEGIEQFTNDPELFEDLFIRVWDLTESEVEDIKLAWTKMPPIVRHGYAPRNLDVPVYSIILQNETESEKWLNDDVGQVMDTADPDFGADQKGSFWDHRYMIMTYTQHPDLTMYYYEIAKSIILQASTSAFVDQNLFDIDLSGSDMAPDPRYIPEHFFARNFTFACRRCFERLDRLSITGKAFKVAGLHINGGSNPNSDVGGVKTLITPIDAEESSE